MLPREKTLSIGITGKSETECIAKIKKDITNKTPKKSLLLATFLSLLCSSSACATTVSLRTGANTIPAVKVNNQPFFPFGFYYTSWYDRDDAKRLNDLRQIADAGFNVIHASLELNDRSFVNEATRLGVYILVEFNEDPISVVNAFKNEPAILGWNVADDADNGKKTPEQILQFQNIVKAADPQHLTYLSAGVPKRTAQFINSADLVGMQTYPVNYEPLSSTHYTIARVVQAAAPSRRPIIANLQTFAWSGSRPPTFQEVRNMTYQALIDGVSGILYYTYYDSGWDMSKHPDLWNGMKSLVPEIKQLSPILLNGNLTKINTGEEDLFAGIWKYQNQAIVVVLNTSHSTTSNAVITLPSQRTSGVEAMFSGRPSGMAVIGNNLSGSIKPKDVHVYSFGISR